MREKAKGFGNTLRSLREDRGWRQEDVARFINVSPGTVGGWESGRRLPNYETLVNLANLFNCTTDYLLGRSKIRIGRMVSREELEKFLPEDKVEQVLDKFVIYIDEKEAEVPEKVKEEIVRKLTEEGYI